MQHKKLFSTLSLSLLASSLLLTTVPSTYATAEINNLKAAVEPIVKEAVEKAPVVTTITTTVEQLDPYHLTNYQEMQAIKYLNHHLATVDSAKMLASTLDLRPVFSKHINPALSGMILSLDGDTPNPYQSFFDQSSVQENKAYYKDYLEKFLSYAPHANYSFAIYPQDKTAKASQRIEVNTKAKPTFLFIDQGYNTTYTQIDNDSLISKGGLLYLAPNRSIYLNIIDLKGHTNQSAFTILLTNKSNQPQLFADSVAEYLDLWVDFAVERAQEQEEWEKQREARLAALNASQAQQEAEGKEKDAQVVELVQDPRPDNMEQMPKRMPESMTIPSVTAKSCPTAPTMEAKKKTALNINYNDNGRTDFYFPTVIGIEKYVKDVLQQEDCVKVKPILPLFLATTAYGPQDYSQKVLVPDFNFNNFQWFSDKVLASFPTNSYIENYRDQLIEEQYQILEQYRHALVK